MAEFFFQNSTTLTSEIRWLEKIIKLRLSDEDAPKSVKMSKVAPSDRPIARVSYSDSFTNFARLRSIPPPVLGEGTFCKFVQEEGLDFNSRILLSLCLANHIMPSLLSSLFLNPETRTIRQPEYGGVMGEYFPFFIPTGLTYVFIMGGYSVGDRLNAQRIFTERHVFQQKSIISLEPHLKGEPSLSGKLAISEQWLDYFTLGTTDTNFDSMKYNNTGPERNGT